MDATRVRIPAPVLVVLAAGGLAFLAGSCASGTAAAYNPPEIPGAHVVGNNACADCHAAYVRKFASTPHARLRSGSDPAGGIGCELCHGPGSLHVSAGGGRGRFILNPATDPKVCFECHGSIEAEFSLPEHHPVTEGRLSCAECHDPHGADIFQPSTGPAMARYNSVCASCHREQTRPVAFEHPAMREGCATCHSPHGSVNRKLLVDADANLCLRCHAQSQGIPGSSGAVFIGIVDHTSFLSRATCWASGCHTAVHGSNVDPRLRY